MQKIISQLTDGGYFLEPIVVTELPLEPGVFQIPGGAAEVSPPNVRDGFTYRLSADGEWIEEEVSAQPEPQEPEPEPVSIVLLVAAARFRISSGADNEASAYMAEYPLVEQQTWPDQRVEAAAYLADNTAPTSVLSGILSQRAAEGLTMEILAQKVLEKAETLKVIGGLISGKRQRLDDALKAAEAGGDREAIGAIGWDAAGL